ncbi:MAG TPA: type II toxin-antitoxin system RelE/ParE family toxin [Myxococcales bacterium]
MTKPIRLDREAEEEIDAAVAWYETQRTGLGLELLEALDEAKARLAESPNALPLAPGVSVQLGVRRCPVYRFPYWLVFVEVPGEIRVLAVAHSRRRPGFWRSRL